MDIKGTFGNDHLVAENESSVNIYGFDGDDWIEATNIGGHAHLQGDSGNDILSVFGAGSAELRGGAGNDTLNIYNGANATLIGGLGDDTYYLELDDFIAAGTAATIVENAGEGRDTLHLSIETVDHPDAPRHFELQDEIENLHINYYVQTGYAVEIDGNAADNDILVWEVGGASRADASRIDGGAGNDHIYANSAGYVTLIGGVGNDFLDHVASGDGVGVLRGGLGNDWMQANGDGRTIMYGGEGSDGFNLSLMGETGWQYREIIADFNADEDRIAFSYISAPDLPEGNLAADNFRIGRSAQDADDRIIFNPETGALYYDSNGNEAGGRTILATVNVQSGTVDHTDFWVTS